MTQLLFSVPLNKVLKAQIAGMCAVKIIFIHLKLDLSDFHLDQNMEETRSVS